MTSKKSPHWVCTKEAASQLGISVKRLLELRASGSLKCDRHWRDVRQPGAARATYRWNIQ